MGRLLWREPNQHRKMMLLPYSQGEPADRLADAVDVDRGARHTKATMN